MLHNENEDPNEREARNSKENTIVGLKREVYVNILSLIIKSFVSGRSV
jgi:hypothetical protein